MQQGRGLKIDRSERQLVQHSVRPGERQRAKVGNSKMICEFEYLAVDS